MHRTGISLPSLRMQRYNLSANRPNIFFKKFFSTNFFARTAKRCRQIAGTADNMCHPSYVLKILLAIIAIVQRPSVLLNGTKVLATSTAPAIRQNHDRTRPGRKKPAAHTTKPMAKKYIGSLLRTTSLVIFSLPHSRQYVTPFELSGLHFAAMAAALSASSSSTYNENITALPVELNKSPLYSTILASMPDSFKMDSSSCSSVTY